MDLELINCEVYALALKTKLDIQVYFGDRVGIAETEKKIDAFILGLESKDSENKE